MSLMVRAGIEKKSQNSKISIKLKFNLILYHAPSLINENSERLVKIVITLNEWPNGYSKNSEENLKIGTKSVELNLVLQIFYQIVYEIWIVVTFEK